MTLHRRRRRRKVPHVLGSAGRAALRMLAGGGVLLAFDFDGTLAAIEERRQQATMTVRVRRRLRALARLYPCVVISGRPHHDLRRRLGDVPLTALAGSHGAESTGATPKASTARTAVRIWATRLRQKLRRLRGVDLECKPHGLAVHYRRAEDKPSVHLAVLAAVAPLPGVRRIHGKDVIELLPVGAPDKGDALALLRRRLKPRVTLYVGDDVTDEDAFRSPGPGRLLSVRVGPAEETFARYRLDAQGEVEVLLDELLRLAPSRAVVRQHSIADRRERRVRVLTR
jgi:trehalose 6-phosphate phosphatase